MDLLPVQAAPGRLVDILRGRDWSGSGRILLIEDDPATREVVTEILTGEGCEVRCATDGRGALAILQSWHPSLILLDLRMPEMDGGTFAQAYRALAVQHAPIVLITASSEDDAAEAALSIHAADTIHKPFDLDELLEVVGRYSPCPDA
jgi:CheY-like chemotaxis protein